MLTVILAGGASRRMGCPKAMLPYSGTTLLQFQIDRYRALGDVAVSVARSGMFPFDGALEITDACPDAGPLNGILAGFSTAAEEIFMTAVDMPCGELKLAERLIALRGDADVCVIRHGNRGYEPLFAAYGAACKDAARVCLSQGKRAMTDLLDIVRVRCVLPEELPDFDLPVLLQNVNTPAEYAALIGRA